MDSNLILVFGIIIISILVLFWIQSYTTNKENINEYSTKKEELNVLIIANKVIREGANIFFKINEAITFKSHNYLSHIEKLCTNHFFQSFPWENTKVEKTALISNISIINQENNFWTLCFTSESIKGHVFCDYWEFEFIEEIGFKLNNIRGN